jgi:thiamine biosynthesis protein ThiI
VLLHYHEVGLKGRNRGTFERLMIRNAEASSRPVVELRFQRLPGRHLATLPPGTDLDALAERLRRVFGCAYFAFPYLVDADLARITDAAIRAIDDVPGESFAVRAKTAHTTFEHGSQDLQRLVGASLLEHGAGRVDLTHPDRTVAIEVVGARAFVYARRFPGPGGLPVDASGTVATLLSAGLDSPVAALRLMRRGARSDLIHFHSQPFTDGSSSRQAAELAGLLARYQGPTVLALVPLAPSQQAIVAACPEPYRTVLYRRQMMRIASRLARASGAQALVTGDSLGQVASQTLENLASVEAASSLPVLRPLIGTDKVEIIDASREHGLFEASSAPCQEACVLFEPARPRTRTTAADCEAAEGDVDLDGLADDAVIASERLVIRAPDRA